MPGQHFSGERALLVHHVARRLGVSGRTVRWWAQNGLIKAFKEARRSGPFGRAMWRRSAVYMSLLPHGARTSMSGPESMASTDPMFRFRTRHADDEIDVTIGPSAGRLVLALVLVVILGALVGTDLIDAQEFIAFLKKLAPL